MRRIILLFASLLLLGSTTRVHAQHRTYDNIDFGIQCLVSPFRACVSVEVSTLFDEDANGTFLSFALSNLQGTPGFDYQPVTKLFRVSVSGLFGVTQFWGTRPVNLGGGGDGWAQGIAIADAFLDETDDVVYGADGLGTTGWHFDHGSRLFGCFLDANFLPGWDDTTCGGIITYSMFVFNDHVQLTKDAAVTLYWNTTGASGQCTTGVDCAHVTPEPVSVLLLGCGLAGLAAARRRRRRSPLG